LSICPFEKGTRWTGICSAGNNALKGEESFLKYKCSKDPLLGADRKVGEENNVKIKSYNSRPTLYPRSRISDLKLS
jgi:hypothetical protein